MAAKTPTAKTTRGKSSLFHQPDADNHPTPASPHHPISSTINHVHHPASEGNIFIGTSITDFFPLSLSASRTHKPRSVAFSFCLSYLHSQRNNYQDEQCRDGQPAYHHHHLPTCHHCHPSPPPPPIHVRVPPARAHIHMQCPLNMRTRHANVSAHTPAHTEHECLRTLVQRKDMWTCYRETCSHWALVGAHAGTFAWHGSIVQ